MTYISKRNGAKVDALLDKVESGDLDNLYVADFTINDLERLLYDDLESLEVNGKALLQALRDHKAIGVLFDNDVPSISLASAYKDDFIYLSFVYMNELYRTSVNLPYNYDEVDESKSGIIYKEETTVYALDTYHEYFLDIDAGDVRKAYLNNQEITCDYNSLRDAVEVDKYIRIAAETGGTVLVNAVFISDTIALTYIIENTLWQITIYRSEDENGNVYGRAYGNEIAKIDLSDTKNGSRYIITDFTLDTIIDGGRIRVTSELIEAIKHNRPLAIYEEGGGRLYNIEAVEAYINNTTDINFEIPYNGGIRVEIRSGAIVVEGSFIDVVPTWHYLNDKVYVADFTVQNIIKDGSVTITEQFVNAVQSKAQILIPITSPTDTNYVVVTTSQGSISAGSFSITIGFIYQTGLYSVAFNGKGTTPSQVTPKITVTDLILKASSFKTINGASVLGTGNISTIQGLSNLVFNKASIGTVNDDGVLEIGDGGLAGLSVKSVIITPKDGVIPIGPYFRYICITVTDNIQIQLNKTFVFTSNEWEILFRVNSAEPITLNVVYSSDYSKTIRWKEGEISHSTLSNGYYRLRATYVMSIHEIWAEIEKFS